MDTKTKKLLLFALACVICLSIVLGLSLKKPSQSPASQSDAVPMLAAAGPPVKYDDPRTQAIADALQAAPQHREDVLALLIYEARVERVDFSKDGSLGLVWIKWIDPENSAVIPGELSLSIARQEKDTKTGKMGWVLHFQVEQDWAKLLSSVPKELLGDEMRSRYMPDVQSEQKDGKVLSGYRLPWEAGKSKYLTGSIGHVFTYKTCPTTCLYAFDFADGTMFSVLAARGGTVKYAVWRYPDNFTEHANYLVLEDKTTNPTTYQVYYHLAQDSIPPELRVIGAKVQQGQYIAQADNTGPSTGHHLHFHVHTSKDSVWGTSVDIVFGDVTVNGGRPRTCAEANNFPGYGSQCMPKNLYTSGNSDRDIPTGTITKPASNQKISARLLKVTAAGKDDKGVDTIQLMYTYDGVWKEAGAPVKGSKLSTTVDLCKLQVPDGSFFLALQVVDKAGKQSKPQEGMVSLVKNYACTPPSTPTGTLIPSSRTPLPAKPTRTIASTRTVTSTRTPIATRTPVATKTELPPPPDLPALNSPVPLLSGEITDAQDLTLTWSGGGEKVTYSSELAGPDHFLRKMDKQPSTTTSWAVGKLPAGSYTWKVTAKNAGGTRENTLVFQVAFADPPPSSEFIPLPPSQKTTAIHLQWKVSSGLADLGTFAIDVKEGDNNWAEWNKTFNPSDRETWYFGKLGASYQFRIHSIDKHGSVEPFHDTSYVKIKMESECAADTYDKKNGRDDSNVGATLIEESQTQQHNFCPGGDEDWLKFIADKGATYKISAWPVSGDTSVRIEVVSPNAVDVMAEMKPAGVNLPTTMEWIVGTNNFPDGRAVETKNRKPQVSSQNSSATKQKTSASLFPTSTPIPVIAVPKASGMYFLHLRPGQDNLAGTDVVYNIRIEKVSKVWSLLPYSAIVAAGLAVLAVLGNLVKKILPARKAKPATQAYAVETQGIPVNPLDRPAAARRSQKNRRSDLNGAYYRMKHWVGQIIHRIRPPRLPNMAMARKPRR